VVAAALLGWSLLAIHKRQLLPGRLPAQSLGWIAAALLGYWAVRLGLSFTGVDAFPRWAAP
jgi:hypothetical protein